jgi:hypothetical protein
MSNTLQPAPQPNARASDDETLYALDVFSAAVTEKFRRLDRENVALNAKLDTLTAIIAGDKSKSGDVIADLPNWRKRDVA